MNINAIVKDDNGQVELLLTNDGKIDTLQSDVRERESPIRARVKSKPCSRN